MGVFGWFPCGWKAGEELEREQGRAARMEGALGRVAELEQGRAEGMEQGRAEGMEGAGKGRRTGAGNSSRDGRSTGNSSRASQTCLVSAGCRAGCNPGFVELERGRARSNYCCSLTALQGRRSSRQSEQAAEAGAKGRAFPASTWARSSSLQNPRRPEQAQTPKGRRALHRGWGESCQ